MKTRYTFHTVLLIALLLGGLFHFSACTSDSKRAETQISVSTPPRPAGQTDVVGLDLRTYRNRAHRIYRSGARGTEAIRRFTYQKRNPGKGSVRLEPVPSGQLPKHAESRQHARSNHLLRQ